MATKHTKTIVRILSALVLMGVNLVLAGAIGAKLTAPSQASSISEHSTLRALELQALADARQAPLDQRADALTRLAAGAPSADVRDRALALLVDHQAAWPDDYRGDFLRAVAPGAVSLARERGLPASVTLAQAILESGWGRSALARRHHNLFGVKAIGGQPGVVFSTREGAGDYQRARFQRFSSWDASLTAHAELLGGSPRYAPARAVLHDSGGDWRSFTKALAPTYATDPLYAARLGELIERYALDRWDALTWREVTPAERGAI